MASPTTLAHPGGVLLLNEDEVRRLLTMDLALRRSAGSAQMALDEAHVHPAPPRGPDHAMRT